MIDLIPAQSDIKPWVFDAFQSLEPSMQQPLQVQSRIIGMEPAPENDGADMFEQAGVLV